MEFICSFSDTLPISYMKSCQWMSLAVILWYATISLCNQCQSPLMLWVWIPLRQGVLDTTLCDKVCQWLATGQRFSPVLRFLDITEIWLKVVLNNITVTYEVLSGTFSILYNHMNKSTNHTTALNLCSFIKLNNQQFKIDKLKKKQTNIWGVFIFWFYLYTDYKILNQTCDIIMSFYIYHHDFTLKFSF